MITCRPAYSIIHRRLLKLNPAENRLDQPTGSNVLEEPLRPARLSPGVCRAPHTDPQTRLRLCIAKFFESSVDIRVLNVNNSGAQSAPTIQLAEASISSLFREMTLGHRFVVIQDNNE